MHKIRRRPKQNFNINFEEINDSKLLSTEKRILIRALQFHKANCKYEYKTLLNSFLVNSLSISEPTLIKHRNNLEKEKYFKLVRIRKGNSFLLEYRFNWTKLKKLNFISDIEKNDFQPVNKQYEKDCFKTNDLITIENSKNLKDEQLYSIKTREKIPNRDKYFSWQSKKIFGNVLKQILKSEQRRQERENDKSYSTEYKFIERA
jgi:hypothetical protein